MLRRFIVSFAATAGTLAALLGAGVTTTGAHQSPATCNSNSIDVTPTREGPGLVVRNGDVISYRVSIRNIDIGDQRACDLTNATVALTLPAADGTPTGQTVTLASATDFPAGTSLTFPGVIPWTVAVNPGVVDAVVKAEVSGTLHDAPVDHAARIEKTLGTAVTQPHTTLSVTASPTGGRAPLTVTYTYREVNDSSTEVPISRVEIIDGNCAPVTYQSGDLNGNQLLDTNEVWIFTCTRTFTEAGSVTSNVVGKGTSTIDNRAVDDELASVTVNVRRPHAVLTKTVTPATGTAPLDATYTYTYTNDGTDPIGELRLTDDNCSPLTHTGGDANGNGVVDPGEQWTFTCARTFTEAGTFPNVVTATGVDTIDGQPVPPLTAQAQVLVNVPVPVTTTPTVLGVSEERAAPRTPAIGGSAQERLPRTGFGGAGTVLLGVGTTGAGAVLLLLARRRRNG